MNRIYFIGLAILLQCNLFAQYRGNIGQPGAGEATSLVDSMGLSIPVGEVVIGTGTKAPNSTDSLLWNAGLFVTGPVRMESLVADALDSLAYFDAQGDIGKIHKNDLGIYGGGADSMGIVIPYGEFIFGTGTKAPGSSDSMTWNAGLYVDALVNFSGLPNLSESAGDSVLLINTSGNIFKSVLGSNFFTANGTANGHRTHDFDGYNLTISDIANFTITSNANWSFNTTANDIRINAITGLGMNIQTTGATNVITINSGNDLYIDATDDLVIDAPDIILEDPLTLSTWDSILVRHPTTGEIQARMASTLGDSLGRNGTAGRIVFETATKAPNSESIFFWDEANNRLGIGTGSPTEALTIIGQMLAYGGNFVRTGSSASVLFNRTDGAAATFGGGNAQAVFLYDENYPLEFRSTSRANTEAKVLNSGTLRVNIAGNGSVGIGTVANASAKLDVSSTTQGLLIPRMTSTQRDAISSPAAGLIIYNTTTTKLEVYNGAWTAVH